MSKPQEIAADVIKILKKDDRYDWLPEIVIELQKELYRNADITVISAVKLAETEQKSLEKQLVERWGEHQVIYVVDPSLLSGLLIKFQDTVIDLTGRNDLAEFRQALS